MARGKKKGDSHDDQDDLVFKALAGADRRKILDLLRDAPMTTGEIGKRLPSLDRTTVMQHLRVLERARLIITHEKGRALPMELPRCQSCAKNSRTLDTGILNAIGETISQVSA